MESPEEVAPGVKLADMKREALAAYYGVSDHDRAIVLRERLRQLKLADPVLKQFAAMSPSDSLPVMRELLKAGPEGVRRVNQAFLAVTA